MAIMRRVRRLHPPGRLCLRVFAATLFVIAALSAHAQTAPRDNAFTLHGGLRDGGSFVDAASNRKLRLDGSGTFAVSLDLGLDGARQLQFHVSQQRSDLQLSAATGASGTTTRLPLTVTYLHLGGTNFFDGPIGRGPYVLGGVGATLLRPGTSEYATELRPSLNLGLGYQLPLGERLALRFEARGYFTLIDSSGGLFCDGGCTLSIRGDGFTQADVQIGVSIRF